MGRDPLDANELPYVYEKAALKTVPSMATVLTRIPLLKDCGYDYTKVVHGEQRLTLHRPLPPQGELVADAHVAAAYDKGAGKGALIYTETEVRLADGRAGALHAALLHLRARRRRLRRPGRLGPAPHPIPARAPDLTETFETRADQALLYRLNGDRNPLHADPDLAQRVGFPAPILHGLCTYGIACRAILKMAAGYDHRRIRALDVRFSTPVYPGETIETDMWLDGGTVSFRCSHSAARRRRGHRPWPVPARLSRRANTVISFSACLSPFFVRGGDAVRGRRRAPHRPARRTPAPCRARARRPSSPGPWRRRREDTRWPFRASSGFAGIPCPGRSAAARRRAACRAASPGGRWTGDGHWAKILLV